MQLRPESSHDRCVLEVRGRVEERDCVRLVDVVCSALASHPRGVVVDLRRTTALAVGVQRALRDLVLGSRRWPEASVVLCIAEPEPGSALAGVAVHPDLADAARHLDERPAGPSERVDLGSDLHSPAQARAVVAACSERLGLDALRDDVTLVVSEMVTNAVRHATPPVALEIHSEHDRVLVSVVDGSSDHPQPRAADEASEGGRGLLLVDLLSDEHGVRPDPPGKTVWAALSRRPGDAP